MRRTLTCIAMIAVFALPGCGVSRQKVSGMVTLGGKPLESGHIEFEPVGSQASSGGAMIANGHFEIANDRGLLPGPYRVRIYSNPPKPEKPAGPPPDRADTPLDGAPPSAPAGPSRERVAAKYNIDSVLTADVKAGGANVFTFDLE